METIDVTVNKRRYTLTTSAESVDAVHGLAETIDRHAGELAGKLDTVPEPVLLLLAGISALEEARSVNGESIRDELLLEASESIQALAGEIRGLCDTIGEDPSG